MNQSWRIPEETEKSFRKALDYASKRRLAELHSTLGQLGEDRLSEAVGLCALMAAYTAIDVVSRRWPTDDGLRMMAGKTAAGNHDEEFGVTEQNVYLFLSQCALGFQPFAEVFRDAFDDPRKFLAAPFFLTVDLLATFAPKGKTIWEFLERIESAYETALLLDLDLLPALMVRARMPQPDRTPGAAS